MRKRVDYYVIKGRSNGSLVYLAFCTLRDAKQFIRANYPLCGFIITGKDSKCNSVTSSFYTPDCGFSRVRKV